jgi:hypothetical protein
MAEQIRADEDKTTDFLEKILISQLALGGVSQQNIRKIVGCDINRVSAIARHINRKRGQSAKERGEEEPNVQRR